MKQLLQYLIFISVLLLLVSIGIADDEQDIFLDAKTKCVEQKWYEAITQFEKFLEQYPESKRVDDAKFWIAYCLEKIPDKQTDAFFAFSELTSTQPGSPWVDDAIVHQVNLAEQFVREGNEQYRQFLYKNLESAEIDVQNRATISLGRLGDKKALPNLEKLTKHDEYGTLAANLSAVLKSKPVAFEKDTVSADIEMIYNKKVKDFSQSEDPETAPPQDSFLWFNSQRYSQYRSMLRKDDKWSKEELQQFAMWHIIDSDEFEEFSKLTEEYDRKEWRRKFWKTHDPTPTTEQNELEEEFSRRIDYVREHFSEPWNYTNFRYLPDEHLRENWYRAPWDSRGELYIKYGEPDVRSVHGWHTEEWVYYKYGVDFIVKQYMTNIYGNAINAGSMTRGLHSNQNFPHPGNYNYAYPMLNNEQQEYLDWNTYNTYLDANFVYKNEMRYEHDYQAEPLSDFELEIFTGDSTLSLKYQIPVSEFEFESHGDTYSITYTERYSIYNEDMREVATGETTKQISGITDEDMVFVQEIDINLPPALYQISIYIKDNNSNKMGIYSQLFESK